MEVSMRKMILAAILASALGVGTAGTVHFALADDNDAGSAPTGPRMELEEHGSAKDGWGRGGPMGMHRFFHMMRTFSLFAPVQDRALTTADVQKIAEALLLWHGNHTWKVAEVKEESNHTISFAYTTADGSVIARFEVDRKTGEFHRIG
jgi:hypothetical protein